MRHLLASALFAFAACAASAQSPIPAAALTAHTVAIENDTRDAGLEAGARDALRNWGALQVVEDPQVADITLHFVKKSTHDGESQQAPGQDGKTSYSYSMTFGEKITMEATLKDGVTPFYATTIDNGKRPGGVTCVNALRTAFREARAH